MLTRQRTLIEKLKYNQRYIWYSEDGIEVSINIIFHKYGIKREVYHGGQINGMFVRNVMYYSEDIIHDFIFLKVAV